MSADPPPDVRGYSVRAVADRLGIPTATLRSWNRRYGIGPSRHEPGKHRRYGESDIAALQRMLALIRAGVSPAGAAAVVTEQRRITVARGDWQLLSTAAFALDTEAVPALLTAHLLAHGVVDTWNMLCRPVFAAIVARQLAGERCVDVEHLLSWSITAVLHSYVPPTTPTNAQAAVLACTGGETHVLPLETLRAALAEHGVRAWMLGADVPTAALADALARTERRPDVVLWSQHESTALTSAVRACAAAGARVFVGGPGWDSALLPVEATPLTTLADAVDRIAGPRDRP
ncbi:MerR family transcriptional regulator [Nocardia amikacinitolerans]|uniref:MerR family transcriptional regulator n=1 Tax=Nocardia amikacinitolerans TaxID=756689 RepID=UPI0020A462C5|nr:MerR family transcriptional regulator [Nocardia amikacinitolerans]